MKKIRYLVIILCALSLFSCSSFNIEAENDVNFLYAKALSELSSGDTTKATESFKKIIDLFPYKQEALEAQIFLIWIYYLDADYVSVEVNSESFLKYYVYNDYTEWVNYMRALIEYEQMGKIERNQSNAYEAFKLYKDIVRVSKNNSYVRDANLKIDVIKYQIAERSMIIAYQYLRDKNYAAALIRYQEIMVYYQDTAFVEEAFYRAIYIWMVLGNNDEAFRIASVFGYNYPDSKWYHKSLKLLQKYSKDKRIINKTMERNPKRL